MSYSYVAIFADIMCNTNCCFTTIMLGLPTMSASTNFTLHRQWLIVPTAARRLSARILKALNSPNSLLNTLLNSWKVGIMVLVSLHSDEELSYAMKSEVKHGSVDSHPVVAFIYYMQRFIHVNL